MPDRRAERKARSKAFLFVSSALVLSVRLSVGEVQARIPKKSNGT